MRLLLDTSVLVAATRSDAGASRQLLRLALERRFVLLLSVPLVLEYEAVLKRAEHLAVSAATMQEMDRLLTALIAVSQPVYRAFFWRPMVRDANDDMVLEAALNGRADLLVTFNVRDFEPAASSLAVKVVAPGTALREIRRNDEKK